ncbi:ABC transporter permease [Gynuella sunshinyii]|uniref:ABC-type dipeptide/oligopeptide/nickel transport system, permease component n=1 Tax=Gynuella sunshinyii YC6258 TaxID=1445510 RepID=A0A0C5UY31_9GAMM|nr:ABC transporter permease [Gynuella sunshinyii]AJQ92195.1 ABC-type dipeptide/oligopeptide/nickel transport system, permease component [Gynuella sunshinyii YC6258]
MFSYIIRRGWQMIPTLLGVMLLLFALYNLVGGDPSYILAGKSLSNEMLASIRAQLGLDKSLPEQFFIFVKQVVTMDFGTSWSTQQPVSDIINNRIGPSIMLILTWQICSLFVSLIFAASVAYFNGSIYDRAVTILSTIAMSISILVYIIAGQYFLAYKMQWFPVYGWGNGFWENFLIYIPLPLLIGLAVSIAPDTRFYRTCFVEEMNSDYVRTAKAKGLSEQTIMLKHVMRNALIPIITSVMTALPYMITGSVLMERFFGIPGLGNEILKAVDSSDFPVIKAITIYLVIAVMIFNLLADLIYKLIDPRVQLH